MKNICLILSLIPVLIFPQKKKLLITLSANEEFDIDNSKIISTATGVNWEIVVRNMDNKKYLLYTKTIKGKSIPVDIRSGEFITSGKEDGKEFFRINKTGVKYGPYESIDPKYNENLMLLYGYSYVKEGMSYYIDLINNKNYGPFYKGGVWYADDKNLIYSYTIKNQTTQKDEVFLFENGKKHGPYESVTYKNAQSQNNQAFISWKDNGKFYTNVPQCKGYAFGGIANSTEMKDGWMIESWDNKYNERMLYLPDGSKLEYNDKTKHMVNLKGEYIKMELVAGAGSYAAYKLSNKGADLGTYAVKKWNRGELDLNDFFDHMLMKVEIKGNWSNGLRDFNYIYSSSKGLIGPYKEDEMRKLFLMKDGFAIIKNDSTLEINGKKTMDRVVWVDVKEYPLVWWAFQKRGDYVYPFKNGVEVTRNEVPNYLKYICTYDNALVKVQRGSEFFIRDKESDKLLGPVGQFDNAYVLTPDKKYFAFERGQDDYVVINGKPISKGFHIFYNEKLKSFYWFVMEEQKISLFTYKVN